MNLIHTWKRSQSFLLLMGLTSLLYTCVADELPEPTVCPPGTATYDSNIRDIINESCAYAGCHDGNSPSVPGNFQSFSGMASFMKDGTVRTRVIDLRDDPVQGMPPSRAAYPQSQKENLTDAEFELLQCWINSGFPER